jgi:glycosyltransferase involved in cell wall biosynthesis
LLADAAAGAKGIAVDTPTARVAAATRNLFIERSLPFVWVACTASTGPLLTAESSIDEPVSKELLPGFTSSLHAARSCSRPSAFVRVVMLLHKSVQHDSRVRREASALARAGHRVTVLELAPLPAGGSELEGFERRSVLPPAAVRRAPLHLYRLAFLVSFIRALVQLRPDVVHAHDAAMLLPGVIGARLTGASLVYDSHEFATSVPYRERAWAWFVAAIERLVLPRCAAVITVSDGIALRLRLRYRLPRPPTVVRNVTALRPPEGGGVGDGAEPGEPRVPHAHRGTGERGLRARLGIDAHTPLVLHQGAPAPARGCEVLIAALALLPGAQLVFLGDPEPGYGGALRQAARAHGVQDRVTLLPAVPIEELLAHTAEADVGVTLLQDTCENHRLALPNKLFEYIAAGVPVVASDLPEIRRLVAEHGVGWCVPPHDPAALADALSLALHRRGDPDLRERLRHAARELSWEREQQRLLGLYEQLAAPSSAAREHEPVAAQRREPRQRTVQAGPHPAGERRGERERAHLQLPPQRGAQLAQPDQAGVGVGSPHSRLPDRDRAPVGKYPASLP